MRFPIKSLIGAGTLGALALAATPPSAAAQHTASTDPMPGVAGTDSLLAGSTVLLRVDGMTCPFCAAGLEKRLTKLPEVDSVLVRISDGLVLIREKTGQVLTDAQLKREVQQAGFSVREVRRP